MISQNPQNFTNISTRSSIFAKWAFNSFYPDVVSQGRILIQKDIVFIGSSTAYCQHELRKQGHLASLNSQSSFGYPSLQEFYLLFTNYRL